jgi:hypothetical protein
MTASRTSILRGNEDDDKKSKSGKVMLAIVVIVGALLAEKLYFLWAWPLP